MKGLLYGGSSRGPEDEGMAGQVGREERRDHVRETMARSCLTGVEIRCGVDRLGSVS